MDVRMLASSIRANFEAGLTSVKADRTFKLYGSGTLSIPNKTIPQLLVQEVLNPFYLFQIWSVILWYFSEYEYYASCILLIAIVSLVS